MGSTARLARLAGLTLSATVLSACQSDESWNPGEDGDCTSHYEHVVTATSLAKLEARLNAIRPHGKPVRFSGIHDGKRTYQLRNSNGRTAAVFDAWRLDDGSWTAGQWAQCIDS